MRVMKGQDKPVLAITMGDAAGIGPEIIVKALAQDKSRHLCRPVVIGDKAVMDDALRFAPKGSGLSFSEGETHFDESVLDVVDVIPVIQPCSPLVDIRAGELSAEGGRGAVAYVQAAVGMAKKGLVAGIVTAPLNKAAMRLAGYAYPGYTELLAEGFGVSNYSLVLSARDSFLFHVTTHVSLRDAIGLVTRERVLGQIKLAHFLAEALGRQGEVIAVAGLNPHAGEDGLFGYEEIDSIVPAIEEARMAGIRIAGPLPADVLFPRMSRGHYRFCVAMYHDQGHAVFKSLYFGEGINLTVGLPVIRTSVDHGTAFDIAGQGVASETSLIAALNLAATLGPTWLRISELANP